MLDRLFKRIGIVAACGIALSGCDVVAQIVNAGTTVAFQKCMENGKNQSLDAKTVKNFCITQSQRSAEIEIWGNGSYYKDDSGKYYFAGRLTNRSGDYVLTELTVHMIRKDQSKNQSKTLDNIWIEPGNSVSYSFGADKVDPQPAESNLEDEGKWSSTAEKGIKIKM